jgi:hypothetical protein
MRKSIPGLGVCDSCGEVFATLERGRCRKCRTPEREAERSLVRERIRDAIRGQCEICGNVAPLDADNWCDECNVIRDERCEIVERLQAALASTAVVLSAQEREVLTLRTRHTARRTARRCGIALGEVASLETRVLQDGAN